MYYETEQGEHELRLLFESKQSSSSPRTDDDDDKLENAREELQVKKPRKTRRSEVSMLEQENAFYRFSPDRPKRVSSVCLYFVCRCLMLMYSTRSF
jgi:hypothetical protein